MTGRVSIVDYDWDSLHIDYDWDSRHVDYDWDSLLVDYDWDSRHGNEAGLGR